MKQKRVVIGKPNLCYTVAICHVKGKRNVFFIFEKHIFGDEYERVSKFYIQRHLIPFVIYKYSKEIECP